MKKLTIFYDADAFAGSIGGVARCFVENIKRISPFVNIILVVPYSENIYLRDYKTKIKRFLPKINFKGKKTILEFLIKAITIFKLCSTKYNIFHLTGESTYFLPFVKSHPLVITIHDLIPEDYNMKKRRNKRKKLINRANHIITVSYFTKERLLYYYPQTPSEKISVIYHGLSKLKKEYYENKWGNYILYVGGRGGYKNFIFFLTSISQILKDYNLKLICTGEPFSKIEQNYIQKLDLKKEQIYQLLVDEKTLNTLYKYAKVFVYPSKTEGFGIPILEAWDNKCPVCLSRASCFPEIARDAAIYFDPNNAIELQNAVKKILNNTEIKELLIKKGTSYLKNYSWEKSAKKIFEIYNKVETKYL